MRAEPDGVSDRTVEALITAGVGLVVVIAVRMLLGIAIGRYERRLSAKDPTLAARRRTTLRFLRKVVVALVAAIAIWKVLSLYPSTDQLVNALLASSAVLALFVGLAFNTPLSNLGSGMLVAFAQPLRIGDRVTVADQTGFVEEMDLLYTTLVTDDARRVFIPNSQLTASMIVNRTIRDPRRIVSASLPVRLGAPIDEARTAAVAGPRRRDGDPSRRVEGARRRRDGERRVADRDGVGTARRRRDPARLGPPRGASRRARGRRLPGRERLRRSRRTSASPQPARAHTQSRRAWASGSVSSRLSVLFSIWRIRSRVTPKARPTSSSVHGASPRSP